MNARDADPHSRATTGRVQTPAKRAVKACHRAASRAFAQKPERNNAPRAPYSVAIGINTSLRRKIGGVKGGLYLAHSAAPKT